MNWAILAMAFGMGFFGSPHCLGMCGGIVTAFGLSMQEMSEGKKNVLMLTYHLGRLISYSLLGVIAGSLGMAVFAPLMGNSVPRIALGAVLMLIGLSMLGLPFLNALEKLGMKLWQSMSPIRKKVFPINTFGKALMAGLLWGFLPCGLVYGALMMAVAGHDVATGALMMFVFGLGTMPMLIATQKTVGILRQNIKKFKLRQVNGAILILSGLAVIFIPTMMHKMHGSHAGHQMNHEMSQMSQTSEPMNHSEMNHEHMNHTMPASTATAMPMNQASMTHDMTNMNHSEMNHDMANMDGMHHEMPMPASSAQ